MISKTLFSMISKRFDRALSARFRHDVRKMAAYFKEISDNAGERLVIPPPRKKQPRPEAA